MSAVRLYAFVHDGYVYSFKDIARSVAKAKSKQDKQDMSEYLFFECELEHRSYGFALVRTKAWWKRWLGL